MDCIGLLILQELLLRLLAIHIHRYIKLERRKMNSVRVTELTVCQLNTGSMVQLPLLFIFSVDYCVWYVQETPTMVFPPNMAPTQKSITYPTLVFIFLLSLNELFTLQHRNILIDNAM